MEQVGPRASLESQEVMRLGRFIRILATGGVVLAPLCVLGHAMEFLTAKLILLPDAEVRLEVTADHALNPLVPDEAAALQAVDRPLEVQVAGSWAPLDQMMPRLIEKHTDWLRCAPPNLPPPPPEAVHALVTASWQWKHPQSELVFRVPKGNMHDVFLWQPVEANQDSRSQWMLLLAGDVTKGIAVLPRKSMNDWSGALTGIILITGLCMATWVLRQKGWKRILSNNS
jgi:hypothetical protein